MSKYFLEVVPKDLPWYKGDGLMTYIDQLKYEFFISDTDKYLEKATAINFEMIYGECGGVPRKFSDRHYQTVRASDVKKMSQKIWKRL